MGECHEYGRPARGVKSDRRVLKSVRATEFGEELRVVERTFETEFCGRIERDICVITCVITRVIKVPFLSNSSCLFPFICECAVLIR